MTGLTMPDGIRDLGPDVAARVSTLVQAAEERQVREGEQAVEEALAIVPRPLRGLVRKVLLG
jgi:hypothetical protein